VDDPFEILAASGGIQMTDRIELAEHRAEGDDLSVPLFIRVAGTRYYPASGQSSPAWRWSSPESPRIRRTDRPRCSARKTDNRSDTSLANTARSWLARSTRDIWSKPWPCAGRMCLPRHSGRSCGSSRSA
jgi:hypothetical protein